MVADVFSNRETRMKEEQLGDQDSAPTLDPFDWSSKEKALKGLADLRRYADSYVDEQISWYRKKKPANQYLGWITRFLVIVATFAAGLIPILAQIMPDVDPAWASVALATAAVLIAIDRYFGFSQAWMRFMTTQQYLEKLKRNFEIEWALEQGRVVDPPVASSMEAAVIRAKQYLSDAAAAVEHETAEWAGELTAALREEETAVRKAREAAEKAKDDAKKASDEADKAKEKADNAHQTADNAHQKANDVMEKLDMAQKNVIGAPAPDYKTDRQGDPGKSGVDKSNVVTPETVANSGTPEDESPPIPDRGNSVRVDPKRART